MQEQKVEYIWELDQPVFTRLGKDGVANSPSFFGGLEDCLEWQMEMRVGNELEGNGSNDDYISNVKRVTMSIFVKLVSMGSQSGAKQEPTDIGIRYRFELRHLNSAVTKSKAMETPELIRVGDPVGVDPFCTLQRASHTSNGSNGGSGSAACKLKVYCVLWIQKYVFKAKSKSTSELLDEYVATRQLQSMTAFMRSMLTDSSSADIVLKVGKEVYNAHKNILSARSKVFAAMFASDMEEAQNHTVEILDFEPEVVQAMLSYIYCGDITTAKDRPCDLLKIADKYELLELKDECEKFIVPSLTVANAAQTAICAHEHNLTTAMPEILSFLNRNRAAIAKTDTLTELVERYPKIILNLYLSQ